MLYCCDQKKHGWKATSITLMNRMSVNTPVVGMKFFNKKGGIDSFNLYQRLYLSFFWGEWFLRVFLCHFS